MCPPPGLHKFPKEAQGLLWSLLLPSRPGVAQQGLPGHLLLSVLSLPAPPSLLPGPFTRPLVRERGKEKKKKTTHSFTTFSTTAAIFPAPLSGRRPRNPQRAGAKPTSGHSVLDPLRRRNPRVRAHALAHENASWGTSPGRPGRMRNERSSRALPLVWRSSCI